MATTKKPAAKTVAKATATASAAHAKKTRQAAAAKTTTKAAAKAAATKTSAVKATGARPAKAAPAPAAAATSAGVKEGDPAPAFALQATGGRTVSLAAMQGRPFVLYFYPKADTPGCTTEACAFNEALTQFKGLGLEVIGVSPDKMPAIEKFAQKYGLDFPLASDPDNAIAQAYGAWGEKVFMGRRSIGLIRSTFLIDKEGRIARAWKKVKVDGHAAEVLEAARAL